ncbi:MAG: hypothetical protein JJU24_09375 [Natronohydrobacter sp.]|nr:hypothetical protein [Natronohydrobacter sp.]
MSRYIVDGSGWHFAVLDALGLVAKPERLAVGTEYEYLMGTNADDRVIALSAARCLQAMAGLSARRMGRCVSGWG